MKNRKRKVKRKELLDYLVRTGLRTGEGMHYSNTTEDMLTASIDLEALFEILEYCNIIER